MTLNLMAAIFDLSNMAPTAGAQLGSREKSKLYDLGYKWSKFGAFGTIWTMIWLSPLTNIYTNLFFNSNMFEHFIHLSNALLNDESYNVF